MAEKSLISWTHGTWNPWVGCDKIAPECAYCYIGRELRKQHREPWGELYLTKTWNQPYIWNEDLVRNGVKKAGGYILAADIYAKRECKRIFTCSLSDFFHAKVD